MTLFAATDLGMWMLPVAIIGGALRVATPYLYVSLGECITERAGRVNLGLEGTLWMGAMSGFGVSLLAHTWGLPFPAWWGVAAAALCGTLMGALHAVICNLPRVNTVAVGIAMMVFGTGLAFYLGKPLNDKSPPQLPTMELGAWSDIEQVRWALRVNVLFLVGIVLAPVLAWMLKNTRWGLMIRLAGESEEAAAALGYSVKKIRIVATAVGGLLAGIGGSYVTLYYPGTWNEELSKGTGLMAVALVIFAKWDPVRCLFAALLFGAAGALGPAMQGQQLSSAAVGYLWYAAPYILTLAIMIATSSRSRAMAGAPMELARAR
jgi:simple sugar transport system permease protein